MPQMGNCVTNRWGAQGVKLCWTEMFTSGRVKKEAQKVQEVIALLGMAQSQEWLGVRFFC